MFFFFDNNRFCIETCPEHVLEKKNLGLGVKYASAGVFNVYAYLYLTLLEERSERKETRRSFRLRSVDEITASRLFNLRLCVTSR